MLATLKCKDDILVMYRGEKSICLYLAVTGPLFAHMAATVTQTRWLRTGIV